MAFPNAVTLLSQLIAISRDGEKGFRAAACEIRDPEVRTLLDECATRCRISSEELEWQVRELDEIPALNGSLQGTLHRIWLEGRSRLTRHNTLTILRECDRGESYAKSRYEAILKKRLPEDVREIVKRQHQGIAGHQQMLQQVRNKKPSIPENSAAPSEAPI